MPSKQIKLFTLDFDFKFAKGLEYASLHVAKFEKEERISKLLSYGFKPQPLAAKWSNVNVVKEKGTPKSDVYHIEADFAVSKKVKTVLEKILGNNVEFLPIKLVGETFEDPNDEFETICKLKSSSEEIFIIHPVAKLQMAVGTKSEDYPGCREYHDFAFRPEDITDLPMFRPPLAPPNQTIVSQEFRDLVKSKKLKGFSFKKISWSASDQLATKKKGSKVMSHTPVKSKSSGKSRPKPKPKTKAPSNPTASKIPASKKFLNVKYDGFLIKSQWEKLQANWDWACDASIPLSEDKPRRPKIAKPISQKQLDKLKKKVDGKFPVEFEKVLLNFSSKVEFFWDIEPDEHPLPDEIEACTFGGGPLWDAKQLPGLIEMAAEPEKSSWLAFRDGLKERLPFLHVGNGDLIAFCMRKGVRNCPIVYLSHENDQSVHDRQIGTSFVDFIINWTNVGCVNIDFCFWEPFYSAKKKKIDGFGKNARRWRKYMETGK